MYRFDLIEDQPLTITLRQYMVGHLSAAILLLVMWAIVLLTEFAAGWLVALAFPVCMIGGLGMLIRVPGWKHRGLGFLGWLLVWAATYVGAVAMLFGIAGSP